MFKSCCPFWLMLFQVLRKIVPPPPNLAKTRWNILGTFTFKQQVNVVFFFFAIFLKQKSLCEKKCFEKPKRGGEKNVLKLFSHISVLSTRRPSSMQSAVAGCVFCVRVHVCVWATLCLWFTAPPTLSPLSVCWSTAMVKEATIRSAINLDTSYLCLPLQGEVCPVTNMINPLPLCWQPPAHTPLPPSSLP